MDAPSPLQLEQLRAAQQRYAHAQSELARGAAQAPAVESEVSARSALYGSPLAHPINDAGTATAIPPHWAPAVHLPPKEAEFALRSKSGANLHFPPADFDTFVYHSTTLANAAGIRDSGLDPAKGGVQPGGSVDLAPPEVEGEERRGGKKFSKINSARTIAGVTIVARSPPISARRRHSTPSRRSATRSTPVSSRRATSWPRHRRAPVRRCCCGSGTDPGTGSFGQAVDGEERQAVPQGAEELGRASHSTQTTKASLRSTRAG